MKKTTIESILFVLVFVGGITLSIGYYLASDFLFVMGGSTCVIFLIPLVLSVLNPEDKP